MSELTERLRSEWPWDLSLSELTEAADRIEQLEAALDRIEQLEAANARWLEKWDRMECEWCGHKQNGEAALEGKP